MQDEKRTVKYNDSVRDECNEQIASYLNELPDYCVAFNSSRIRQIQVRARKENLRDIKLFLRFIKETNPLFKDKTIKDITPDVLEQFTAADFEDFANWISEYTGKDKNGRDTVYTNSDVGIKRKLSSVRALYRFLYNREYISANPSLKADLPKLQRKNAATTIILEKHQREPFFAEVEAAYDTAFDKIEDEMRIKGKNSKRTLLLPAIAMRDKAMIYLLISTGMRLSELCGIDCTDYSRELGTINIIRKSDKKDIVYISKETQEILDTYLDEFRCQFEPDNDNYQAMFLSEKKTRISPRSVELIVKNIADAALGTNNNISPHKLRATFGTEYYNQTRDIKATSIAMGHDSMQTTATYYVRDDDHAREQARNIKI